MSMVKVTSHLDELAADMAKIKTEARVVMRATVREGLKVGNDLAKGFAKRTSGTHAKKYPGTFSYEMTKSLFGTSSQVISGEYGPETRGQGLLAPILERGSRNNPPHFNLDRSADIIGGSFAREVGERIDGLFW